MPQDVGWVTERLQVGGTTVHCRRSTDGDGVPIVHIHGFAIAGGYLMPTARLLARRWVNVVPDLPGYGHSERRDHVLGIPALAEALLAVLDALGIDQAVLLGNSMGCPVALEVAHAAPERVHRLVLVSPAGGVQNQPLARALGQLGKDMFRGEPADVPGRAAGLREVRTDQRAPAVRRADPLPLPGPPGAHAGADPGRPGRPRSR